MRILDQLFQLKFASKQLQRQSKRSQKEIRKEKMKLKKVTLFLHVHEQDIYILNRLLNREMQMELASTQKMQFAIKTKESITCVCLLVLMRLHLDSKQQFV